MTKLPQRILSFSLGVSVASVFAIFLLTSFEIVARYVFNKPTTWSMDVTNYLLCLSVFSAFPYVTARGTNIAVTILTEKFTGIFAHISRMFVELVTAVSCAAAAYMCALILLPQYQRMTMTATAFAIPRWWLTLLILYGFLMSAALHASRIFVPNRS